MVMANITEVEVVAAAGSDATTATVTTATKPATTTATAAVEEDDTTAATTKATTSVGVTTASAATTATEAIKEDDTAAATTSAAEMTATSAATDGTGTTPTEPFTLSILGSTGGEYAVDYADHVRLLDAEPGPSAGECRERIEEVRRDAEETTAVRLRGGGGRVLRERDHGRRGYR